MKTSLKIFVLAAVLLIDFKVTYSQKYDSFFVYKEQKVAEVNMDTLRYRKAWGFDIYASTNGFGMGAFYRYQYTPDFYGFIDFGVSEAKDDNEMEQYNYYTGQMYTPYKLNRIIMIPVTVGLQYRLFRDDIVETFKPYAVIGLGPTFLFTTPYEREFFNSLGWAQAHYTIGGYIGMGANFGFDKKNLMGVNVRYYLIPYPDGLASLENKPKTMFGGLYITLSFGIMY
jgi:hypothetical protein